MSGNQVFEASTVSNAKLTIAAHPASVPTEGGTVGTAREEVMALLEESLFRMRKGYGMFLQIHISIMDVTPERLTVGISMNHRFEGASVALNVRDVSSSFCRAGSS